MNLSEARAALSAPDRIVTERFAILRLIANLVNSEKQAEARELLLRALEHRELFDEVEPILDALVREVGLFPYAEVENLDLSDRIAYEYHKPQNLEDVVVFHREQAEIYRRLLEGESVILSAPTSFGKSRIIDAVIASQHYRNIVVIVPTLALIDETRRRLAAFAPHYKIVTQVSQEPGDRNVFVFTAERANAYRLFPRIDFVVIDEFYKIGALSEDKHRTVALNQAFYRLVKGGAQFYMLGPCVKEIPPGLEERFRCTFYPTTFATVVSEEVTVPDSDDDIRSLVNLCRSLSEPTLIFCRSPKRVNEVAGALVSAGLGLDSGLADAADWLARTFHPDWILPKALLSSIGIHHGKLPRSIAQFTVRAFNEEQLRFLICTSTLIEGVNTKAKNVIILDNEIAREKFDYFTFNNIKGRSGRMFEHFVGRVFLFHPPPQELLPLVDFPLFTQTADTPDSILVQMDSEDLSADSLLRIDKYKRQDLLPLAILKEHFVVEPEDLLRLADAIKLLPVERANNLSWNRIPNFEQLKFCCELIWEHLIDRAHAGVFTGSQLAFKANRLRMNPSVRKRVEDELVPGQFSAQSADEAVERVLEFDRTWASFELPRLLSALSAVQNHVLSQRGLRTGDYTFYTSQLENLFRRPFQVALEEYGLPLQITDKLGPILRDSDSIDAAISRIKNVASDQVNLEPFERELFEDCRTYL